MTHWHIHIRGDAQPGARELGALVLTREAADIEVRVERSSQVGREAHADACNQNCFGSRAR